MTISTTEQFKSENERIEKQGRMLIYKERKSGPGRVAQLLRVLPNMPRFLVLSSVRTHTRINQ